MCDFPAAWWKRSPAPPRWRRRRGPRPGSASRFTELSSLAREDHRAQAGRGGVRGLPGRALRRADRGPRARDGQPDRGTALRRAAAESGSARSTDRRASSPRRRAPRGLSRWTGSGASAKRVAVAAGFDRHRGRFDLGVHPSCNAIGPGDCRLVLRFDQGDFAAGVLTILHEVGHGLYEQGLDPSSLWDTDG